MRRDDPRPGVHQNLLELLGRDLCRIERYGEQLPAFSRTLELEFNRQLCVLEICGDTRQRLNVSSALPGHLAPHGGHRCGRRYRFGGTDNLGGTDNRR
jgi:hypothetical protein